MWTGTATAGAATARCTLAAAGVAVPPLMLAMLARATPVASPVRSPSSRRAGILAARPPARLILDVTTDRCGCEGGPADCQPSRPANTDEVPGEPRLRSRYVAGLRAVAPNASAQPTASPREGAPRRPKWSSGSLSAVATLEGLDSCTCVVVRRSRRCPGRRHRANDCGEPPDGRAQTTSTNNAHK